MEVVSNPIEQDTQSTIEPVKPNQSLYINNLNERVKKDGKELFKFNSRILLLDFSNLPESILRRKSSKTNISILFIV
jgi:hypothetical protein